MYKAANSDNQIIGRRMYCLCVHESLFRGLVAPEAPLLGCVLCDLLCGWQDIIENSALL